MKFLRMVVGMGSVSLPNDLFDSLDARAREQFDVHEVDTVRLAVAQVGGPCSIVECEISGYSRRELCGFEVVTRLSSLPEIVERSQRLEIPLFAPAFNISGDPRDSAQSMLPMPKDGCTSGWLSISDLQLIGYLPIRAVRLHGQGVSSYVEMSYR